MELIIGGVDVTERIAPDAVIATDRTGRADDARFIFARDARWWNWDIERGEKIVWRSDGYTTGVLYADGRQPEKGRFVLSASSIPPSDANAACWAGYDEVTLGLLLRRYAGLLGLRYAGYGIDETIRYARVARENETALAFLSRILNAEQAVVKVSDGRLAAISLPQIDAGDAAKAINVRSGDAHTYKNDAWARWGAVKIVTSRFTRTVRTEPGPEHVFYGLPVQGIEQAERWGMGLLRAHNAECETLTVTRPLDGSICALERIDVTGESVYEGRWVVTLAQHDTQESCTRVTMRRAIYGGAQ